MKALVDYADFEYTYERFGYKQNEYCSDHVVYVSNGYNFICDYRTDLDSKQSVYAEYITSHSCSKTTMFDIVSKIGKAKLVTREDKIKQRHEHDAEHGATHTLEQYQEYTEHENLRDLYIETEESEEIKYANFNEPVWSMAKANTKFYNIPSAL